MKFVQVADPRYSSYIDYSSKVMLGTVYYKGIAGISSMQGMTREFNDEKVVKIFTALWEAAQKITCPTESRQMSFWKGWNRQV